MSNQKNQLQLPLHLDKDYEYFSTLWEYKSKQNHHTNEKQNNRAKDWAIELTENESFQQSNRERVDATISYLKQQNLLQETDRVIDIGCRPGRFSVEFAKYTKEVYSSDISENMLELAQEYAESQNAKNIRYAPCDFITLDIKKTKLGKEI